MWNYAPTMTTNQFQNSATYNNYMVNSPNYNMTTNNNYYQQPQYTAPNYNITNIYNNFCMAQQPQFMAPQCIQPAVLQGQFFGQSSLQMPFMNNIGQMMQSFVENFVIQSLMQSFQSMFAPQQIDQTEITAEAKAWGDPHFNVTNSKGEDLMTNHKGTDGNTYNILDARGNDGLLVDAKYVPHTDPNNPQIMGKIRVMAGNEELLFDKDGPTTINGNVLEKGETYTTQDGTTIKVLDNGNVDVVSKEKDATLHLVNAGEHLDLLVKEGSKLGNGYQQLGGVLGTLLNNRDNLNSIGDVDHINDINGDGKNDDLNGNGFIEDNEFAKLGYNFDVTETREIV